MAWILRTEYRTKIVSLRRLCTPPEESPSTGISANDYLMLLPLLFHVIYNGSCVYLVMESSLYSLPTPKTPHKQCSRHDRLRFHTLYFDTGFNQDVIALQLNHTPRQVQYALANRLTPQKIPSVWACHADMRRSASFHKTLTEVLISSHRQPFTGDQRATESLAL